jgi:kumamolisin
VWNDLANHEGATGTGTSSVFPQPQWQEATSQLSKSGRSIPDVSANADPSTGYEALVDGQASVLGGSSVAAPLWAGLVALLNQGLGKNIGYFNPILYRKIGPTDAFNPIPRGIGIQPKPGWTPQSGWGTPDGKKMLAALRKLQ